MNRCITGSLIYDSEPITSLLKLVSGSDKEFYEPMGSLLAHSAVRCCRGFEKAHVPAGTALAVIGNAVLYENPEVLAVEERRLPYTLFPRLLFELRIEGRHSCVVSGTHGKTTTTAMLSQILLEGGMDPTIHIGGRLDAVGGTLWELCDGQRSVGAVFAELRARHGQEAEPVEERAGRFLHQLLQGGFLELRRNG